MTTAALSTFSPPVREWFERAFGEPTPPRVQGWPAIASGESTLICAPTGSGKTLSASAVEELLVERGFRPGPRKLVLSA